MSERNIFYRHRRHLLWLWLSVAIIVIDRVTKIWMSEALLLNESYEITSFFNLTLSHNQGAAFGMLHNAGGWQQWLFGIIAVIVSLVIVVWLNRMRNDQTVWLPIALALILGGALGNLFDRVFIGHVIDFFDLHYKEWHWPVFNVADIAICVGAFMLMLDFIFDHQKQKIVKRRFGK